MALQEKTKNSTEQVTVTAPDGSTEYIPEDLPTDFGEFTPDFPDDGQPMVTDDSINGAPDEGQAADPAEMSKEDRDKGLREVYGEATKALREAHLAEFNQLRTKLAAERGIDWSPRPSATERKLAEIRQMMADDPALARALAHLA